MLHALMNEVRELRDKKHPQSDAKHAEAAKELQEQHTTLEARYKKNEDLIVDYEKKLTATAEAFIRLEKVQEDNKQRFDEQGARFEELQAEMESLKRGQREEKQADASSRLVEHECGAIREELWKMERDTSSLRNDMEQALNSERRERLDLGRAIEEEARKRQVALDACMGEKDTHALSAVRALNLRLSDVETEVNGALMREVSNVSLHLEALKTDIEATRRDMDTVRGSIRELARSRRDALPPDFAELRRVVHDLAQVSRWQGEKLDELARGVEVAREGHSSIGRAMSVSVPSNPRSQREGRESFSVAPRRDLPRSPRDRDDPRGTTDVSRMGSCSLDASLGTTGMCANAATLSPRLIAPPPLTLTSPRILGDLGSDIFTHETGVLSLMSGN